MSLLALRSVSKSFGALKVTDDISFAIAAGETLGILGPNGAGKTTLFNLISGDVRCDRGSVHYEGRDITSLKAHQRCRLGLGRSHLVPQPFGHVGALIFWALNKYFSDYGTWYLLGLGLLAIVVTIFFKQGLWGFLQQRYGWSLFPTQRRLLPQVKPKLD